MKIYRKKEDGTYETTTATQEEFDTLYSKAGWTDVEPIDILGAVSEESKKTQTFIAEEELDALAPIGYTAQMPYQNGFIPVSEYLSLLFPETKDNFYYPGAEDAILDGLKVNEIKTLQDRLVKTSWLDTEEYSVEYGRPGTNTRTALYNALKESNALGGIGYNGAIDIQLQNPYSPKYEPKIYQPTDRVTRLQKVDAIANSLGLSFSNKERNYYEKILETLEEKEFRVDETIGRIAVEGQKTTTTPKLAPGVDPLTEMPIQRVVGQAVTQEPIPSQFDATANLQEQIKTDFTGVMERQTDVNKARMNAGNIAQSIMRLKALGG